MDCEVLKLFIIIHELLENSKINVNSRIKPSELKKNSRKNTKLKEKTQNSRKKLNFSAYSYVGHEENVANLQACTNHPNTKIRASNFLQLSHECLTQASFLDAFLAPGVSKNADISFPFEL